MKVLIPFLSLFTLATCLYRPTVSLPAKSKDPSDSEVRIAFGSCFKIFGWSNEIFKGVAEMRPDLWMWGGDAAYTDNTILSGISGNSGASLERVQRKFNESKEEPHYKQLRQSTPVIGIWDDHDYNINDGDRTNPLKHELRALYLSFLDEPPSSPRSTAADSGLFQDYLLQQGGLTIHIILVDVRFDFDKKSGERFGQQQRDWLREAFQRQKGADLTLVSFGVQAIPDLRFGTERLAWKNKRYILDLIRENERSNVYLISGDVHYARLYHLGCESIAGYDVHEATSSGLTHHVDNFFLVAKHILDFFTPDLVAESPLFAYYNFGLLRIQKQDSGEVKMKVEIRTLGAELAMQKEFDVSRDFKFDKEKLNYGDMCYAAHAKHKSILFVNHATKALVTVKDVRQHLVMIAIFMVISLLMSGVLKLIASLLNFIKKLFW